MKYIKALIAFIMGLLGKSTHTVESSPGEEVMEPVKTRARGGTATLNIVDEGAYQAPDDEVTEPEDSELNEYDELDEDQVDTLLKEESVKSVQEFQEEINKLKQAEEGTLVDFESSVSPATDLDDLNQDVDYSEDSHQPAVMNDLSTEDIERIATQLGVHRETVKLVAPDKIANAAKVLGISISTVKSAL